MGNGADPVSWWEVYQGLIVWIVCGMEILLWPSLEGSVRLYQVLGLWCWDHLAVLQEFSSGCAYCSQNAFLSRWSVFSLWQLLISFYFFLLIFYIMMVLCVNFFFFPILGIFSLCGLEGWCLSVTLENAQWLSLWIFPPPHFSLLSLAGDI